MRGRVEKVRKNDSMENTLTWAYGQSAPLEQPIVVLKKRQGVPDIAGKNEEEVRYRRKMRDREETSPFINQDKREREREFNDLIPEVTKEVICTLHGEVNCRKVTY